MDAESFLIIYVVGIILLVYGIRPLLKCKVSVSATCKGFEEGWSNDRVYYYPQFLTPDTRITLKDALCILFGIGCLTVCVFGFIL